MPRGETVVSPLPPGAGRVRDLNFPDYTVAGAAANTQMRCRITGAHLNGQANSFGGLSQAAFFFHNGSDAATMNSTGSGTGGSVSFFNVCNVNIRTVKPPYWPQDDDWNVNRIVWIGSVSIVPTSTDDTGFQLVNGSAQTQAIGRTPQLGFGIQYNPTGVFLRTNNGGGVVDTLLKTNGVGGWDSTQQHAYDMRIISAMPTSEAIFKLIIDDALVLTLTWAAGSILPTPQAAIPSFFPILINNSSGGGNVATKNLSFQCSTTEAGCL